MWDVLYRREDRGVCALYGERNRHGSRVWWWCTAASERRRRIWRYSLCMPTGRQYFSAPFVFSSCPGGAPRVQLFPARDAERWVGFRFLGEGRGGQASSVSGSVDQSIKRGPEAALVEVAPEPARNHLPAAAERQVDENESESDDRMSSPEYGVKEDDEEESLFAPEQYVRRKSVESEGLFVSE
jgi:hypothetical protein